MKIRVHRNLGTILADSLGCPPLAEGSEATVDDKAGDALVARGLATDITPPPPKPVVKAEPVVEVKPEPVPEVLKTEAAPAALKTPAAPSQIKKSTK